MVLNYLTFLREGKDSRWENREFHIGDRVVVLEKGPFDGKRGTVMKIISLLDDAYCLVEFDEDFDEVWNCFSKHNLDKINDKEKIKEDDIEWF